MRLHTFLWLVIPVCAASFPSFAAGKAVYLDLGFEEGDLGSGVVVSGDSADPAYRGKLDGKSLLLSNHSSSHDQIAWGRSGTHHSRQCVGFDYYSGPDSTLVQFLDVPGILRLDIGSEGRHRVDVYYDLSQQVILPFLDGSLDESLITRANWQRFSEARSMRIAAAADAPDAREETLRLEIDNLMWMGAVEVPAADGYRACR